MVRVREILKGAHTSFVEKLVTLAAKNCTYRIYHLIILYPGISDAENLKFPKYF